jgi:hypothetical protein
MAAHSFEDLVGNRDAALAHCLGHSQRGLLGIGE